MQTRRPDLDGHGYTPELVAHWLARWDLLVSLAESPRTSAHHLGHRDDQGGGA